MLSNEKIAAIYELREAVETKVHAEVALDARPAPETRAALLDATLEVEAKTQRAIDVCHTCGHAHAPDEAHDNVINVDFRGGERGPKTDPAS
jgi:ABC-type nickel/cobalt efflux system permease component RcnA